MIVDCELNIILTYIFYKKQIVSVIWLSPNHIMLSWYA